MEHFGPFSFHVIMSDAVDVVGRAVLGLDSETIFIGGEVYVVHPPTIRRMVGAARYLRKAGEIETVGGIIETLSDDSMARALSWLVDGSERLADKFLDADANEVAEGLIVCLDLIDPRNFTMLSVLSRNVRKLTARQRS